MVRTGKERQRNGCVAVRGPILCCLLAICWPFLSGFLAVPLPFVYRLFAACLHETNSFRSVMEGSLPPGFEATTGTGPLPVRSVSVPFLSTVDQKPSNAAPYINFLLHSGIGVGSIDRM